MRLLDQAEQQALADRQVAAALVLAGRRDPLEGLPSVFAQGALLDAALAEEPKAITPDDLHRLELLKALGVA